MNYKPSFLQECARLGYACLLFVLLPLLVIVLRKKTAAVEGSHRAIWRERFGFVEPPVASNGILFHCVSVGEVVTASALIHRLRSDYPNLPITITTTTPTGSARVKSLFGDSVHHFYLPFDLPFAMNTMLDRVKPQLVVITEVELWPNLIHGCWRKSIPVTVINARMTTRSATRYKKLSALFIPMLNKLACVCAQGQRDFDNYAFLGASPEQLVLTNNLKFDQPSLTQVPEDNPFLAFNKPDSLTLVGGSTHDGEEAALVNAYRQLTEQGKALQLVLVPRHPQRFEAVANWLTEHGVAFSRSTELNDYATPNPVLLVDEMGKLNIAYHAAHIAFVGGSLTDRGGHNALEAAGAGIPVVMGPHTYNNPAICETLIDAQSLTIIDTPAALIPILTQWFDNPEQRVKQGKAGVEVLQQNQGALAQTASVLERYIKSDL